MEILEELLNKINFLEFNYEFLSIILKIMAKKKKGVVVKADQEHLVERMAARIATKI